LCDFGDITQKKPKKFSRILASPKLCACQTGHCGLESLITKIAQNEYFPGLLGKYAAAD